MVFPSSDRVLYGNNPLQQVICQLRFPPILRIDSDNAADFQDEIRDDYPLYSEEDSMQDLPLPEPLVKLINAGPRPNPVKKFSSPDQQWTVSLAQNFIALTAERYERWEGFRDRLCRGVIALQQIYKPAFYTRVGLRYRDVIYRSNLELHDVPWSELLAPSIVSELASDLAHAVREVNHVTLIDLGNGQGRARIRHGLANDTETDEEVYHIDADFFSDERTECDAVNQKLDFFKTQAARFFRWCLTERLHDAMDPQPL